MSMGERPQAMGERSQPRSFQASAALPSMPNKKQPPTSATSRKDVPGKLPRISSGTALPSIHGGGKPGLHHVESVELEKTPHVKKSLAPMPHKRERKKKDKESNDDNTHNEAHNTQSSSKKDRKAEEKQMIKEQVAVALKAVREVFQTPKGRNILVLETKVERARKDDSYITNKVKRKHDTDSLGISFTIPARVMALGWESGQHLVVTDVTPKPGVKSSLEISDVVVAVDDAEVHSIDDLKQCVAGKKKMHFKCIRDDTEISDEELLETQERIEKGLKAAVKAKVKESLKARRHKDKENKKHR